VSAVDFGFCVPWAVLELFVLSTSGVVACANRTWGRVIEANQVRDIGFCANKQGNDYQPTQIEVKNKSQK